MRARSLRGALELGTGLHRRHRGVRAHRARILLAARLAATQTRTAARLRLERIGCSSAGHWLAALCCVGGQCVPQSDDAASWLQSVLVWRCTTWSALVLGSWTRV